ncbi:uncharacterized protein LOC107265974 [Cephus cinctus]|uniref:Uncharacterized protein LOC107265974 n=1 Tax=Cephus cinctus TaxID=211228 RepID=A0AAJ7FH21_CEPCN|nr:uncharacterized protein LOC107265974 [Cephus cinctus]
MTSIFDLFDGVRGSVKETTLMFGQTTGHAGPPKSSISNISGEAPTKIFGTMGIKPKGLSLRSISDMNVRPNSPRPTKVYKGCKEYEFLKPNLTQVDTFGCPISPRSQNKLPKNQKCQESSSARKSPKVNLMKKLNNEYVFKSPLVPWKTVKKIYPEPEVLAPFYDEEEELNNIYSRTLEKEYKHLTIAFNKATLQEDEGFVSDPEFLPSPEKLSIQMFDEGFDNESIVNYSLDLPEISDDDLE